MTVPVARDGYLLEPGHGEALWFSLRGEATSLAMPPPDLRPKDARLLSAAAEEHGIDIHNQPIMTVQGEHQ